MRGVYGCSAVRAIAYKCSATHPNDGRVNEWLLLLPLQTELLSIRTRVIDLEILYVCSSESDKVVIFAWRWNLLVWFALTCQTAFSPVRSDWE